MKRRTSTLLLLLLAFCAARVEGGVQKVINTADSGTGSLRQAIINANSDPALPRSIVLTTSGPVIDLLSTLSIITRPVSFTINNGSVPVRLSLTTSAANTRTMRVQSDIGLALSDALLTIGVQSSSTASSALYSATNLVLTGDFGSHLTNSSTGATAYALYAGKTLTLDGAFATGASVFAEAPHGVYGLYSVGNITLSGPFSGSVTANATTEGTVYAIRSGTAETALLSIGGGLTSAGSITATALNVDNSSASNVYALFSGGEIAIGQSGGTTGISGTVKARAAKDNARGIHAKTVTLYGGIPAGGSVTVSAGAESAEGIEADAVLSLIGDIGGSVSATTGSGGGAYALHSGTSLSITGTLTSGASLVASSGSSRARAIYAEGGDLLMTGSVEGSIVGTAGTTDASGMFSSSSVTLTRDIAKSGRVGATAQNGGAYAIQGAKGVRIGGSVSGEVTAISAASAGRVYGIYAGGDTTTALDISGGITETGSIRAEALNRTGSLVCGLYSSGSVAIGKSEGKVGIGGSVIARAGLDEAYAISGNAVQVYGGITGRGTLLATAEGTRAYGIFSATTIEIDGSIGESASVTATSGGKYAYGMFATTGVSISGAVLGALTASSSHGGSVYGIATGNASESTGISIAGGIASTGSIEATALNTENSYDSSVYALSSGGAIVIGQRGREEGIRGSISATAGYSGAMAVRGSAITLYGGLSATGSIKASAALSGASGLEAVTTISVIGDIAGQISATVEREAAAYALHAGTGLSITGDIAAGARISASAGSSDAYALYVESGSLGIGGALAGSVTAIAGSYSAAGLYVLGGGVHGATPDDPLTIAGELSAEAHGAAAAIMAEGPMNLLVTGTLSGVDTKGSGLGYSVRSGSFGARGSFVEGPQSADKVRVAGNGALLGHLSLGAGSDTLILEDSASVTGTIDMGDNDDQLLMSGRARVTGSVVMGAGDDTLTLQGSASIGGGVAGGEGGEISGDRLVLSGWEGLIPAASSGWERIEVVNRSDVLLDAVSPIQLASSNGQQLSFMIEAGSTLRAKAGSVGRYEIAGNLENAGLLDLRNGSAGDHVTVTGSYVGSGGAIGLDMALGGWSDSNPEQLDLLVVGAEGTSGGSVSGRTLLRIRNISPDGTIRMTSSKGLLLVKVNGTSTADAFALDPSDSTVSGAEARLVEYGSDWYLQIKGGSDVLSPEAPPVPDSQRILGGIGPMAEALGDDSVPGFHERISIQGQGRWWSRTTGSRFITGVESGSVTVKADGYSGTLQAGCELGASGSGAGHHPMGLYVGTGILQSEIRGSSGESAGEADLFIMSIGGYTGVGESGGWYLEGSAQAVRYSIYARFGTDRAKGSAAMWGYNASLEGGRRVKLSDTFSVEPTVQLIMHRLGGFSVETPDGVAHQQPMNGVRCRTGVAATLIPEGWSVSPSLELHAERLFEASPQVSFEGAGWTYSVSRERVRLGGSLGFSSRSLKQSTVEYTLKAGVMAGLEGYGSRAYLLIAALRKSW